MISPKYFREIPQRYRLEASRCKGCVELDDGVKITTQIVETDLNKLQIGQNVKLVFRRIQDDGKAGIHCYGYKAVVS
jgi:uncharacterized OB-fold protein